MKVITGKYGKVEFQNCFAGMEKLSDKSFELGFVDPPYNVEYGNSTFSKFGIPYQFEGKKLYKDKLPDFCYEAMMRGLFIELTRICKVVIIHPGHVNESLWYLIQPPTGRLTQYIKNPKIGSTIAHLHFVEPMLVYGKPKTRWPVDVYKSIQWWGFIKKHKKEFAHKFDHPCPMGTDFLEEMIYDYSPKNIFNPMAGSGALEEVAESLSIPYLAFEINDDYYEDVQYRIRRGQIRKHKVMAKMANRKKQEEGKQLSLF